MNNLSKKKLILIGTTACCALGTLCVLGASNSIFENFKNVAATDSNVTFTLNNDNHPTITTAETKSGSFDISYTSSTTGETRQETFKYSKAITYDDGFIKLHSGAYLKKSSFSYGLQSIKVNFTSDDKTATLAVKYSYVENTDWSGANYLENGVAKTIYGNYFTLNPTCGSAYTVDIQSIEFTYNCSTVEKAPYFSSGFEKITDIGKTKTLTVTGRDDPELSLTSEDTSVATVDTDTKVVTGVSFGMATIKSSCCSQESSLVVGVCDSSYPYKTISKKSNDECIASPGEFCYANAGTGGKLDPDATSISNGYINTTVKKVASTAAGDAAILRILPQKDSVKTYDVKVYIQVSKAAIVFDGDSLEATNLTEGLNVLNLTYCNYNETSSSYVGYKIKLGTNTTYRMMFVFTEQSA